MARVSPELLARCLDDLRSGQTTLDAVLASHPEVQQELRALLEAPLAIPRGPIAPAPSAAFRQRARAELLTRLAETPQPWWQRFFDSLAVPTPRFGLALPLLLAVLLGLGGFGGAAYAAQDTLPGDLLYPLKTGLETAQVAMIFSESGRVEEYLAQAAERLEELTLAQERGRVNALTGLSRAYANAALGFEGDDFVNLVLTFQTGEPLPALLERLKTVERASGREPGAPRWASRTLDLDLLMYGDLVGQFAGVTLPRPDIVERSYVLGPLAELAPGRRHPALGETFAALWQRFDRDSHPLVEVSLEGED